MNISEIDLRNANNELKKAIQNKEHMEEVWTHFQAIYRGYCEERKIPILENMNFILNNMLELAVAV